MERKVQSKKRYLLAFLIGTFIFINVFLFTYSISYFEYRRISVEQQQLSYQVFKDKLYYSLFNQSVCSSETFKKISGDLRSQASIIDALETRLGKNDEKVLFMKKFYSLVELEHFEFVKEVNANCAFQVPTIMFFYSNSDSDIKRSENLGSLLGSVYSRNPDLVIYSFDLYLADELIEGLKSKYNITAPLTIIINEKTKLVDPKNIDEIENYIK